MNRKINDVWEKLSAILEDAHVPIFELEGENYVLISDTHLGNGSGADDFHNNESALLKALDYYMEKQFRLILLGDIEEFWQFDLNEIKKRYENTVYSRIRKFPQEHITRLFGNHDYEWGGFIDPISENAASSAAPEALKLVDNRGTVRILLVHGHQGSIESDKFSWFSRFWVHVFRYVEPLAVKLGLYSTTSATKSQISKDYERTFYQWAKQNKLMIICGHSHRAIFASKSYAENLEEKIALLKAENAKIDVTHSRRLEIVRELHALKKELNDEKAKGRHRLWAIFGWPHRY
jgi:UDP-2,3-diacylglucosamine pyrophosphatase LpxH